MTQFKKWSFLGSILFLTIGSFQYFFQQQKVEPAYAAAGDVAVTITRAGDAQAVSGANIQVNCPATGNSIVLTEAPPSSGNYSGSFLGQCNNGDALLATIQVSGFVDQAALAFPGNYNPGTDPDCGSNTQCLNVTNFQPGVAITVEDAGSTPITGATVSSASVGCYAAPGGVYLCIEPEGAGCPTTDTATANANGFLANTGNYNRRCNGNDAQSQITIQLAVDPNAGGGGIFKFLQQQESESNKETILPKINTKAIDIQIEELKLESTNPILICPFQTEEKDLDVYSFYTPQNAPISPIPGEIVQPGIFGFKNTQGKNVRIEFNSTNPGNNDNWNFEVTRSLYEAVGVLLSSTKYIYRASSTNTLQLVQISDAQFFNPQTLQVIGNQTIYEYDENGNLARAFIHPDFNENLREELAFDAITPPSSALDHFIPRSSCQLANAPQLPPEKTAPLEIANPIIQSPSILEFEYDANSNEVRVDCPVETAVAGIESFLFSKLFAPGIIEPGNLPLDLVYFIVCDNETTNLGLGERLGVINSFASTFNRVPLSTEDWIDVLFIAHGSEPIQKPSEKKFDEAKNLFVKLFDRQPNEQDPRDREKLDQLVFGIRPLQRDLEKEYGAILEFGSIFSAFPASNMDWNVVRTLAYGDDVIDLNKVDRQLADIRSSLEKGPCTEEEIAALNAQKALLEQEAESLTKKQDKLKDEIKACNDKSSDMQTKKNDANTKAEDAGKKSDDAQKEADKADQEIADLEKDIKDLQETLTGGDNVETKSTTDPLGGINSGAAITFDGGVTWVVATGESGAQQLAENLANNPGIVKDLQNKKNELNEKKADKQKAEENKEKADKEKADAEKEASDLEKQLEAKKADTAKKEKDLDDIGKRIDELNKKIAEFNEVAKKCDIAAAGAKREASEKLNEAKKKLDKMPPEEKEEAENIFDENATDEEKGADTDAGYAGGAADKAADKLEEAMRAASGCKDGDKKCGGTYSTGKTLIGSGTEGWFQTLLYLRGGGLDGDVKYNEMVNDVQDAFGNVESIEQVGLAIGTTVEVLSGSSILGIGMAIPGLVYGAWSNIATEAALNRIAEIRNVVPNPTIDGDLFFYGGWDKYSQDTRIERFICLDGIWQPNGSSLVSTKITCEYRDPAIEVVPIPEGNLPDYSEKENGNWRNPDSLKKFSEWRATQLNEHQPFGTCKEQIFTYSPSCG